MNLRLILLIFSLSFGTFSILSTKVGVVGFLSSIADHFAVSLPRASLFLSLFALIIALSGPILPLLLRKLERKKLLLSILAMYALSNFLQTKVDDFTSALLLRLWLAFLLPVFAAMSFSTAASSVTPKNRQRAVSIIILGGSSGIVVGLPLTSFIAHALGFEWAMYTLALLNSAAFLLVLICVPVIIPNQHKKLTAPLRSLKQPLVWNALLTTTIISASLMCAYAFITQYLEVVSEVETQLISVCLLIFGLSGMLGNLIAGQSLTFIPKLTLIYFPLLLILTYILISLFGHNMLWMWGLLGLWGLLFGIGNNIEQYSIANQIQESTEFANGLFMSFSNIGSSLGTALAGLILSLSSIEYTMAGASILSMFSLILILMRYKALGTRI